MFGLNRRARAEPEPLARVEPLYSEADLMRHAHAALATGILSATSSSLALAQAAAPPVPAEPLGWYEGLTWLWVALLVISIAALIWWAIGRARGS